MRGIGVKVRPALGPQRSYSLNFCTLHACAGVILPLDFGLKHDD
jgi:hypothetical protein